MITGQEIEKLAIDASEQQYDSPQFVFRKGYIAGFKAAQSKLYSEEEVKTLFENWLNTKIQEELMKISGEIDSLDGVSFKDWFEQNKK